VAANKNIQTVTSQSPCTFICLYRIIDVVLWFTCSFISLFTWSK